MSTIMCSFYKNEGGPKETLFERSGYPYYQLIRVFNDYDVDGVGLAVYKIIEDPNKTIEKPTYSSITKDLIHELGEYN